MALAIIDFLLFDRSHAQFTIDTGTNPFYRIKVGRLVAQREGINWLDDIAHTTPLQRLPTAGLELNTSRQIGLPSSWFDKDNCYVQLFSFKTQDGKSPAWSQTIKVPVGFRNAVKGDYLLSLSQNSPGMTPDFNNCRTVTQGPGYAEQQSIEDILLEGIKVVAPVILGALAGGGKSAADKTNGDKSSADKSSGLLSPDLLNNLLHSLLTGFAPVATNVSKQSSISTSADDGNRFDADGAQEYARPFIFGIDDALLATLAGPIIKEGLQLLPQLLNSQNQAKQQKMDASNKLITDILADTNKRLIMQQLLSNMPQAGAGQPNADVAQLLQLMQQAAATAPAGTAAPTPAATAKSLSFDDQPGYTAPEEAAQPSGFALGDRAAYSLSASANLVFDTPTQLPWNGVKKALYNKSTAAVFKIKLSVPDPAPKNPLDKAIFKFTFREIDSQKNALEKTFKQKNIAANTFIDFLFTKEEMASLPANKNLMIFAEIRWLTASRKELKALGSTEIIAIDSYFVKSQGRPVSLERELNDMKTYRAFWNKVWESPVLDAAGTPKNGVKKYNWELNANMKYIFALTAKHDSNGLMQTKTLQADKDPDSLSDKTEGRMKAGIELSITELNKLCTLWDKQAPLKDAQLEAINNLDFAKYNTAELIHNLKLKGKAGERGMVWIVPILKLVAVTLNKIKETLPSGQIAAVDEETVQFPVPVAARIMGLKSA